MKNYSIILIVLMIFVVAGCAQRPVVPEEPRPDIPKVYQPVQDPAPEPAKKESIPLDTKALDEEIYRALPTTHKVEKSECLWFIAEYSEIYNDPFMWPLIYKDNLNKINDPDLIYPDQIFSIPRDFTKSELTESRRRAGAPKPYFPPDNARIPPRLKYDPDRSF